MTRQAFEACVNELITATGHHYLHSSPETLSRFETAVAAMLRHAPAGPVPALQQPRVTAQATEVQP